VGGPAVGPTRPEARGAGTGMQRAGPPAPLPPALGPVAGVFGGTLSWNSGPDRLKMRSMVRLNRIYTRTGDDGTTALGDGTRLPKHHLRIASYGTIDELSAVLGLALAHGGEGDLRDWILAIQNDLLDLGADLCLPGTEGDRLRVTPDYVERLEQLLDRVNEPLEPLESFVLPGGTPAAAWLRLGRTVCRRAERCLTELIEASDGPDRVNPEVLRYLNRLSDLLFVLARDANDHGRGDVLWKPGGGRS